MAGKFAVFDINSPGSHSETPKDIFDAAEKGNTNYIIKLIERSIEFDVNMKDNLQRTALHWAAEIGHITTAEALLEYGIDQFSPECNGRTALHLAARAANPQMIKTLLTPLSAAEKEKLINLPDNFGITAVFLTTQKGSEGAPAFEMLMSFGGRYSEMSCPKAAQGQHATAAPTPA